MNVVKRIFFLYSQFYFYLNLIFKRKLLKKSNKSNYFFRTTIKGNNSNTLIFDGNCQLFNSSIRIEGNNNYVFIGKKTEIRNSDIIIKGNNNNIIIEKDCFFRNISLIMEKNDNKLTIGQGTTNSGRVEFYIKEGTRIEIGTNCMISRDIIIRTSDGHSILMDKRRINHSQNIIIGDNCWISQHVTILKGVTIPNNTIVGVGSIVTKSFTEENIVIAGVPARKVKENVTWDRKLLES